MNSLNDLDDDYDRRIQMGEKMQKLIDGYGAERLAKAIVDIWKSENN